LALLLAAAGCRGCDPAPTASGGGAQTHAPLDVAKPEPAAKTGVLIGSVRLAPGAELPSYAPEQMERKVLKHIERGAFPESCTPPKLDDRKPVRLTSDGKLAGVLVAASDFARNPPHAPRTWDVTIKDCRLTPSLVVAVQGDTLRLSSEVNFPFMPQLGSSPLSETLVPGQTKDYPLQANGVSSVLCGFTAPCGRTDVVVLLHALYAVTDAEGNFRIEGFPADETVHVNAWHPLFAAQEQTVRVPAGGEQRLELVIAPLAQPTAAAPAEQTAPVAPAPAAPRPE
jgi:hypothetical protein